MLNKYIVLYNFGKGHYEEQILCKYFESGPGVQEEMSLKDISYLELWQSLWSVEQIHLCNFGRFTTHISYLEL